MAEWTDDGCKLGSLVSTHHHKDKGNHNKNKDNNKDNKTAPLSLRVMENDSSNLECDAETTWWFNSMLEHQ